MLTLAVMGERFGARPSALHKLVDETVAYAFDVAAVLVLAQNDHKLARARAMQQAALMMGGGGDVEVELE